MEKRRFAQQDVLDQKQRMAEHFSLQRCAISCLQNSGVSEETIQALTSLTQTIFPAEEEFLRNVEALVGKNYQKRILHCAAISHAYAVTGPAYTYTTEDELYNDLVLMWKRSSLQMKALCDANNIRYYHFLQPNQYVEGLISLHIYAN